MTREDRYWQAVIRRDAAHDGRFIYAVATTNVYCVPSCPSRVARRWNVRFYSTPDAARDAGYRACLKCRPDRPNAHTAIEAVVHEISRYIERHAAAPLTLSAIAKKSGYSAAHLQRRFSAIVGSSPKVYQMAIRNRPLKRGLKLQKRVDDAIYDAGYGSHSRVYEKLSRTLGMTPTQYRAGGQGLQIHYATSDTPLGRIVIGATERGICCLHFADDRAALVKNLRAEFPNATLTPMPTAQRGNFSTWMRMLDAYLAGRSTTLELPLDIRGTAFQTLVWKYLQTIPAGQVRSYSEVANAIDKPAAVRAVASSCARNKISIVIPCHRVIRGSGDLAGYRWGLNRKRALLDLERRARSTQRDS